MMPEIRAGRRKSVFAAGMIILAGVWAYANSFAGPFVYDDGSSIATNPTIQRLWPLGPVLNPPGAGSTVSGRPVVNLSLALNYAIGGLEVRGYHVANLAIHLLAALILFGLVRRTLLRILPGRYRFGESAGLIAWAVALLWCVHPLQTESVAYLSQRAESLMGLFYLLTLYAFVRGAESTRPFGWFLTSVLACGLGMATKEVMVTAPLMVILYDRTFVGGSFREAWRHRRAVHVALGGTWIILAMLLAGTHGRGGTAGFATLVSWPTYLANEFPVVVNYLRLSIWPSPLIFGYGGFLTHDVPKIGSSAALVLGLAAATIIAMRIAPRIGFLGAWFFAILAPTSSFVPIATETAADHRMYLPLAAVVGGIVLAGWRWLGPWSLTLFGVVGLALIFLTLRRNGDYQSNVALWKDSVAKQPANPLAHFNLGVALSAAGEADAAEAQYQEAVRLDPDYPEALLNLGNAWLKVGRNAEAAGCFQRALRARPAYAEACDGLGTALVNEGRDEEGMRWMRQAIRLRPNFSEAYHNLGLALAKQGREEDAVEDFRTVVKLRPADSEAHSDLAQVLAYFGRMDGAIAEYKQALGLSPNSADTDYKLGNALMQAGRIQEAIYHYREVLRLEPGRTEAQANLALAMRRLGPGQEAESELQAARRPEDK